ncbi:uncharacterized protein EV420DRAFT_1486141 [Desarmillaria tabescens]|uniref:Uncharacterized protein n=1 Tax=Armillaria tabescens TaxID=1929756 RepID=A0AA39JEQ6_ARMTA|nr:uncharacterized protein EV420DRAFT_1486141 [Desarmillaria tabescens]KAK0439959.1 hypothetical protein EV420DRAFT_1486141 [Desarmillaria tabescens]
MNRVRAVRSFAIVEVSQGRREAVVPRLGWWKKRVQADEKRIQDFASDKIPPVTRSEDLNSPGLAIHEFLRILLYHEDSTNYTFNATTARYQTTSSLYIGIKPPDAGEGLIKESLSEFDWMTLKVQTPAPPTEVFHLDLYAILGCQETPWAIRQISMHVILPISHGWISYEERVDSWMPFNGYTNPGNIRIQIERLNVGVEIRETYAMKNDEETSGQKMEGPAMMDYHGCKTRPGRTLNEPTKPWKKRCRVPYWLLLLYSHWIAITRPAVTMQFLDKGNQIGIARMAIILWRERDVKDIVPEKITQLSSGQQHLILLDEKGKWKEDLSEKRIADASRWTGIRSIYLREDVVNKSREREGLAFTISVLLLSLGIPKLKDTKQA